MIFDKVEEGDDWCGARGDWENEVFGWITGWGREVDFVKITHHCGCQE